MTEIAFLTSVKGLLLGTSWLLLWSKDILSKNLISYTGLELKRIFSNALSTHESFVRQTAQKKPRIESQYQTYTQG